MSIIKEKLEEKFAKDFYGEVFKKDRKLKYEDFQTSLQQAMYDHIIQSP